MTKRRRRRVNFGRAYVSGDMSVALHEIHEARTCEEAKGAITRAGKVIRQMHRHLLAINGDLSIWRKFSAELKHKKHRFVKTCTR